MGEGEKRAVPPRGRDIGAQISGVFGLVFVAVNTGALPVVARTVALGVASVALAVIVVLSLRSHGRRARGADPATGPTGPTGPSPFLRRYWLVVAIEAVALIVGARVLSEVGHPELGVAWVAFVVGAHFFALAVVFGLARFHVLGVVVTALGLAGFVVRALGHIDAVALISGALSGFVLLGFGLWAFAPSASVRVSRGD